MKPNLFIVGAPKCGTTAWVEYLGRHPSIHFSKIKEPHYFALDLPGLREVTTLDDYDALFAGSGDAKVLGEASVLYLYSETAAVEIARYNPDAKILIFLRERPQFLQSWHGQVLYSFQESVADFATAWRLSGKRTADTIPKTCREPKVLDYERVGRFGEQVERILAAFPAEQVRIFQYRDWVGDPGAAYREILQFLGVDDDGFNNFAPVNTAKRHRWDAMGRFLAHPPRALLPLIRVAKRLAGKESFGLADALTRVNKRATERAPIEPSLMAEIDHHYDEDERRLQGILAGLKVTA